MQVDTVPIDVLNYTRVCVTGLPRDIRLGQLESMLAQNCQNRIMRIDLRDRFAYVDFENANDAISCLGNYNINKSVITVERVSSNATSPIETTVVVPMPENHVPSVTPAEMKPSKVVPSHHRALSDSETLRKFTPNSDALIEGVKGKRSRMQEEDMMLDYVLAEGSPLSNMLGSPNDHNGVTAELPPKPPPVKVSSPDDHFLDREQGEEEDGPLISPQHKKRTTKFSRVRGGHHRRVYSDGDVLRNFEPAPHHTVQPLIIPSSNMSQSSSMPSSPSAESSMAMDGNGNIPLPRRNRTGLSYKCGKCGQPKKGHVCPGTPLRGSGDSELSYSWQLEANSIFKDMEAALADDGELSIGTPFASSSKVSRSNSSSSSRPPAMSRSNSWDPQLTRHPSSENVLASPSVSGALPTSTSSGGGSSGGAYKCGKCGQPKKGHVCKAVGTHVARQKSSEGGEGRSKGGGGSKSKSGSASNSVPSSLLPSNGVGSGLPSPELQKSMMDGVQSLELSDMDMMLADLAFAAPNRPPPVETPDEGSADLPSSGITATSQTSLSPDMFSPGTMIQQLLAAPTPSPAAANNFVGAVVAEGSEKMSTTP